MKPLLRRALFVFGAVTVVLANGCASYPQGITKAEWDRMSASQKAKILADEEKQVRKITEHYPKDGQGFRSVIRDDQQTRERAPELLGR
jgi:hypothetical protein